MSVKHYCERCMARVPFRGGLCTVCHPAPTPVPAALDTLTLGLWPDQAPSNGVGTSDAAAAALDPATLENREKRVVWALYNREEEGATREELEALTGLSGNTVRPRVDNLMEKGFLCCRDAGGHAVPRPVRGEPSEAVTRPTRSGHPAHVVYLSDSGRRAVERALHANERSEAA